MNSLRKRLWEAMDLCRGSMEITHIIELFTHVAFIAKEAPESFQTIVNTGQAKQLEALVAAGESLMSRHPEVACSAPEQHRVDARVINVAIKVFADVTDFKLLAQLLRDFTKEAGRMAGGIASNLNMERIFTALVDDCSNKTLYD